VKEKIEVGFRGVFFFVTFFWTSKRKLNAFLNFKSQFSELNI
jgi:hypothetical protein